MTTAPRRYALVGCGRSKLDRAAPAREFYTGPLFRAALELAEASHGTNVWILSAKHDLVFVDEWLEPYDLALSDTTAEYREKWASAVIYNLTDTDEPTRPAHLTVYAGAAYVDTLRAHLPNSWTLDDPMKGLGQGERLAWLKARRAALTATTAAASSAAPSPSAGPSASPLELSMSTAIPTTLSHEQRSEAFMAALALEDGLKELESLRAKLLAGLDAKAEAMRQQHARQMRAATTGVSPEAPEQLAMPLLETVPAPAVAETQAEKDEEPPPEPPRPKGRSRSRTSTPAQKGEKRAEAPASARTSTRASRLPPAPIVTQEFLDALPAPRVPCCECTHSVADHEGGTGRCSGKVKGRPCKCTRFTAVAVELPGAPGWKVRQFKGRLSTGEGGELAYSLVGGTMQETLPLWWVPKYGLAFQNGAAVSCVFSYLGMKATTLSYERDPRWNWVPREVLRALAEHMGATWPAPREESAAPEAHQPEQAPAEEQSADEQDGPGLTLGERQVLTAARDNPITRKGAGALLGMGDKLTKQRLDGLVRRGFLAQLRGLYILTKTGAAIPAEPDGKREDTPCECDNCGGTFKKSELQPVGNAFYCPACKAEADDQDGKAGDAPAPQAAHDVPELDDPFTTPPTDGEAAPEFLALDLTALYPVLGKPREGWHRTYSVRVDGSSPRACEACGTRERPRGFIRFKSEDRKSRRGEYTGGASFSMALCLEHCTVESVERAWQNRAHRVEQERLARLQAEESQDASQDSTSAPEPLPDEAPAAPVDLFSRPWPAIDEARFPGWYVLVCPGFVGKPDSITAGRLHEVYLGLDVRGPEGLEVRNLCWYPAAEGGGCVMVGPKIDPEGASLSVLPGGLYAALVQHLAERWPAPEVPAAEPPKAKKARARKTAPSQDAAPHPAPSGTGPGHKLPSRKGVAWGFTLGAVHGQEIDVLVHRTPRNGPSQLFPAARWSLDIEGWTSSAPLAEVPGEVVKQLVKALRAEDSPAREAVQRAASQEQAPAAAPLAPVEPSSKPGAWRVELSERHEGGSIVPVWLVSDADERRAATWWSGTNTLKCSHHLAGTLVGEELAAHHALQDWWKANRQIVTSLERACVEGGVPGLKVYEPESLGAGPHTYALSSRRTLEAWEGEGEEAKPYVDFVEPTERGDVWLRVGPFVLEEGGLLTTTNAEASAWSADNEVVVREAEDFIRRGLILELRQEVAS